ncbi:MAG: anti-sigma factor family protein [Vicinamibacterales bacterium]
MACAQYLSSIHDLVDVTIGSIRRAELELHLDQCDECRALVADLDRIRDAAADLPLVAAPDRVWLQLAGRLRQEGRIHDTATVAPRYTARVWLAAAAAVIIAVGASMYLVMPRLHLGARTALAPVAASVAQKAAGNAAGPASVESAQSEVDQAQMQFENAITDLEKVTKANQKALDPTTAATIDKNLNIIDQAIAENRAAVRTEPTSVAARSTLFDALRQKVALLQDTLTLINEMRKGNNAAAAQLVNKS